MSIDACSVLDNRVLLTNWPVTTVRAYISAAPGLVGRQNGMLVSKLYCYSLPSALDALWAWEALEGAFEVPTEHTNSLKIWV